MDCYRCLIQWGYQTVHGTNPVTYDLPIPFEEAPFTVAISTGNSGNHASCGGFTKTTIVLRAGTTAGVWDTVGFFIIGCQLQWRNNPGLWAIPFTEFVAGGITMTRTGSQSSGTWYGDSGTISLTGYTASCATNESWVSSISGSAIAVGL